MAGYDFDELCMRIDAVAWALKSLIAHLEMHHDLDGAGLCSALRESAKGRGSHPGLERSAELIRLMADDVDAARQVRQRWAHED